MIKWLYFFLGAMFPMFAFAADPSSSGSLSFSPPSGDISVIFLGNLFGTVDGVLHGSGSQIMGNMFGVFNSAVLALGGIIIMYTLIVSTMNTAHEGQFLGQKWSSIWIPVRSTMGLALIIPKASGYCLMQIFVMWVVVQGIGAADKVWGSALSYLNRGGVIIKAQQASPISIDKDGTDNDPTFAGAYTMLVGQVCMLGIQNELEATRKGYLDAKNKKLGGYCTSNNPVNQSFCNTAVPDFISSVNFVAKQGIADIAPPYTISMPNFAGSSPYSFLNGICGTISWNNFNSCTQNFVDGKAVGGCASSILSKSEMDTVAKARALALNVMYSRLTDIAQTMIDNVPDETKDEPTFSSIAKAPFGVPQTADGQACVKSAETDIEQFKQSCVNWGVNYASNNPPIFTTGTGFLNSILDYNGIMLPNLNLLKQINDIEQAKKGREFIEKSNREGWIMAGSYFFDLVQLNGNAADLDMTKDKDSGLKSSTVFDKNQLSSVFTKSSPTPYAKLNEWLPSPDNKMPRRLQQYIDLIDGGSDYGIVKPPKFNLNTATVVQGFQSSTVNGYVQNASLVSLPGQPGFQGLRIPFPSIKLPKPEIHPLEKIPFSDCGYALLTCLGRWVGEFIFNTLVIGIYTALTALAAEFIIDLVNIFIQVPLKMLSVIFISSLQQISIPGTNPIVALARMGESYINQAGNMWMNMLMLSITTSLIPIIGKFIFVLITLAMPLVIAWLGVMLGVGFITAYYIPILPFLIFTFASIGWMIAVIEAMVAAPIVALGVTHPEGHDAFGKGEQAVMILMNVFLRPAMMIIGYVSGIALSYVGVWLLNAGFEHAIGFITTAPDKLQNPAPSIFSQEWRDGYAQSWRDYFGMVEPKSAGNVAVKDTGIRLGYKDWAGIFAYFFSVVAYTMSYLTIVQKAFTLIHYLPDKVLRWIGGQPEGIGGETAGWTEETKGQIKDAGTATIGGQGKIGEKLGAAGAQAIQSVKDKASQAAAIGTGGVNPVPPPAGDSKDKKEDE